MADEIKISLDLDIKNAIKGIEQFNKQATSSLKGLGVAIGVIKTAAVALGGAIAFGKIIKEATQADESLSKMAVALKLSGSYSRSSMADLEDFSNTIQRATGFAGNLAQESLSMAKSFGLSNEESKRLVRTAADLAKVTGGSLDSSARQLIDTYSGQSKALKKLFPELANYSEAQLKAGIAIDVINSRIGGAAEAMNNTFSGAIAGVSNEFSDLLKTLGQFITQNPVVIRMVQAVSAAIAGLTEFLISNKDGISNFITAFFIGFTEMMPSVISGIQLLVGSLGVVAKLLAMATIGAADFIKALLNFGPIRAFVQALISGIGAIVAAFLKLSELIIDIPGVGSTLKLAGFDVEGAKKSLQELTDGALNMVVYDQTGAIIDGLDKVAVAAAGSLDRVDSAVQAVGGGLDKAKAASSDFAKELRKLPKEAKSAAEYVSGPMKTITEEAVLMRRAFEDLTKAMFQMSTQNPFNALMAYLGRGELARQIADFEGKFGALQDKMKMLTSAGLVGIGNAAIQGAQGAKSLIANGAGAVAEAYAPGSGEFAKQLTETILQGPEKKEELESVRRQIEQTDALIKSLEDSSLQRPLSMLEQAQLDQSKDRKKELEQLATTIEEGNKKTLTYQVRAFAKELPNIIRTIPAVLKDLVKELPSILADLIPELVMAFIESIPDIIEGWIRSGPQLINGIFQGIGNLLGRIFGEGASKFLSDLGNAILDIPNKIIQAIVDAFNGLTGGIFEGGDGGMWKTIQNTVFTGGLNLVADALGVEGDVGDFMRDPIGSVAGVFGLAKGGIVPEGFPGDTYPAMLSSGETVLPPPVSARFHDFMEKTNPESGNNSGEMTRMMSLLQEVLNADRSVSVNIDGRQMADAIYSLNKKGYRTS